MQHVSLRRLPDQLFKGRSDVRRDDTHDVPLGRGRQRNLQVPLQAIEAVERESATVFQQPDHAAGRGIVLLLASLYRRWRREHLTAQMATQFLQLVDRRTQRRLPDDSHEHAGDLLVNRSLTTRGTRVARRERRVPDLNPRRTPVSVGTVAPVTFRGGRLVRFARFVGVLNAGIRAGLGRGRTLRRGAGDLGFLSHHGGGLFRALPEEQLPQVANRRVLVVDQVGHVGVRLEDPANQGTVLLIERLLDAAEDFLQLLALHFDELRRVSHPAATSKWNTLHRPRPWSRPGFASTHQCSKGAAISQEQIGAGSSPRAHWPPVGSRAGSHWVACRKQHRQLVRGQPLCVSIRSRGPPGETALRKPLLAEPKPLAVVHKDFQRCRLAIAEDEDRSDERVVLQSFLAEPRQGIDSPAEIGRFDGDQDLHLRRDLEHYRAFQKLRDSASTSAAS